MDAELAHQIGNGLNNLSSQLLEHQRASARDRSALLTKIDALDDKFDKKFGALAKDIVDVCDRGGVQHRGFADRLDAIERRLDTEQAHRAGRDQAKKFFADATTWTLEHGWKLALVVFVGWQTLMPMIERTFAPQSVSIRGLTP